MGKSSGAVNRGGRPAKVSKPADWKGEGCRRCEQRPDRGKAARQSAQGHRPPPEDLAEQTDESARLLKMGAFCLRDMCRTILPNDRSWARQPKQLQLETLMLHHERLAAVFASIAAATPGTLPAPAAMPPPAARPPQLAAALQPLSQSQ